jgi:hypothetical protein
MNDEPQNTEKTPEQEQTDALLGEIDRLGGELNQTRAALDQARATQPVTPEQLRERHGQALLDVLTGPNTGAVGQQVI